MSAAHTKTYTLDELQAMKQKADSHWSRFDGMDEAELDQAAAEEEQAFGFAPDSYENATIVLPIDRPVDVEKQRVTIRLDSDVLAFFKQAGRGYQTRINDALRLFMQTMQRQR